MKVKIGMNKAQRILDLEDVSAGALYWDSVLWLQRWEWLRRFKLRLHIEGSAVGPNVRRMENAGH